MSDQAEVERWLAIRTEAALSIDPDTAEATWCLGSYLDPYGIDRMRSLEQSTVGQLYFARAPDSDIWVSFHDLQDDIEEARWKKVRSRFPVSGDSNGTCPHRFDGQPVSTIFGLMCTDCRRPVVRVENTEAGVVALCASCGILWSSGELDAGVD
jgi:hypothetical protein